MAKKKLPAFIQAKIDAAKAKKGSVTPSKVKLKKGKRTATKVSVKK